MLCITGNCICSQINVHFRGWKGPERINAKINLLMENQILNQLDQTQELKIKILINRLRNTKSIFHTLKLFENNGTSFACVISTILTYIVVLLQLKTIEIPLH